MTFLSDCCVVWFHTKNALKKKFSSSSFEIFLAKKILRLERSEKRYDFSEAFSLLPSLVSDRAQISLIISSFFLLLLPWSLKRKRRRSASRDF